MLVQKKGFRQQCFFLDTLLLNINSMAAGSAATNNHFQSKCKSKSKKRDDYFPLLYDSVHAAHR